MTNRQTPGEFTLTVAGLGLHLQQAGSGPGALVLHHDIGPMGWQPFHEALAQSFTTYVPDLPGFGQSQRPDWARHPRDLAVLMLQALDALELPSVALIGLGFGGWIAAEMATMASRRLSLLTLVAPVGIKPREGELLDQMMLSHLDYVKAGFRDEAEYERQFAEEPDAEQTLCWDLAREMVARIGWKPYMFSHQLPYLLANVSTPALVVCGGQDRVVPLDCGRLYAEKLGNARLEVLAGAGHFIDLERPEELALLIAKNTGS
jgi:pimeloyl-ACP methyl ester carboxylesterase